MKLYCSTGTFVGRPNGRDHRLIVQYGDKIKCDGFELMMCENWYPKLDTVINDLAHSGFEFPVIHTNKEIGDMLSSIPNSEFQKCIDLWKTDMEAACRIGSVNAVAHIWGIPDSDMYPERIFERVLILNEISKSNGIEMLSENCVCKYGSPVQHLIDFVEKCPELRVIIDVRPAQIHQELGYVYSARKLWKNNVHHVHISDYHGGYKDFTKLRPIYGPGEGDIDFTRFFDFIKEIGYDGTYTLESPAVLDKGVNYNQINKYLDYIRAGLA